MLQQIISHITDILFKTGNNFVRFIPVYEIQGSRLNVAAAINCSRLIGAGMAKSLYRPVARNGIH